MARDLRLFYAFRLLATSYLWVPIFFFFLLSRGLGFDDMMILSAIYSLTVIVVEVPTGALADRIGRRHSMMAGALAMVASCLTAYGAHSLGVFVVAEMLAAVSISLCSGADSAYLYDLLSDNGRGDEYPRREGTASAWHQGGMAIACVAGGFLAEIDLGLPYLVTAFVAAAAFVVALFMRDEPQTLRARDRATSTSVRTEVGAYFRLMARSVGDVRRNRRLAWIIFYSAVVFALLRATIYLYQPYLNARGFGYWQTGLVFAGVFLVATVVAHQAQALRRWLGEEVLVWGLLGTLALSFIVLNQFVGQWALFALLVQAATKGLYSPLVKPILNREISDSGRRATVLSIESIARRLAMGAFSLAAAFFGPESAITAGGILGLAGFAVLLLASGSKATRRAARAVVALPADEPATPQVAAAATSGPRRHQD